jgi:hypothetical protein
MKHLTCLAALAVLLVLACGCGASTGPRAHPSTADAKYHFLPGGIRALAEGRVPHGPTFAISGLRYRFGGRLGTDLQAQTEPHAKRSGAAGSFTPRLREPFEWSTEDGCSVTGSWSILYGLLRDRTDRGVLFIGSRRYPLRTAAIPALFHLSGALGYAALSRTPTRVIVRDAAGRVVQDQDLGRGAGGHCTPGESSSLVVGEG